MNFRFEVYDKNGNNITDKENWVIDARGYLYYETNDIDDPLKDADFSSVYRDIRLKIIFE